MNIGFQAAPSDGGKMRFVEVRWGDDQYFAGSVNPAANASRLTFWQGLATEMGIPVDVLELEYLPQLLDAIAKADKDCRPRSAASGRLENANVVTDVDGKRHVIPIPMQTIIETIERSTGGFPKRVDGALFVEDGHGISWLQSRQSLFGYLQSTIGAVKWHGGVSCVKQCEVFEELRRTSDRFIAVEELPHEPMIAGHYYAGQPIPPGDGKALAWLLARFNPATDIDADLIRAAFITPMWGGPPGTRPCFLITSDDGRGAGKSTLAEIVGEIFGGVLQFSHMEDVETIKTRLLSPAALPRRVALLDNVKTHKFSWADLEAMITAFEIGGHRMFVGEGTRPNTLTWFVTVNGAALSTDLAQRSVIIKIRRPERSATWLEETRQFVQEHRLEILGDIIAALRVEPSPLERFTRWSTWERDVLQRMPEPADAQRVVEERQTAVDVDGEEATIIEEHFETELLRLEYDLQSQRVFIPSRIAADWYIKATGEKGNIVAIGRILRQMMTEGRLHQIQPNRTNARGKGVVWVGQNATAFTPVSVDLEERMTERTERWH